MAGDKYPEKIYSVAKTYRPGDPVEVEEHRVRRTALLYIGPTQGGREWHVGVDVVDEGAFAGTFGPLAYGRSPELAIERALVRLAGAAEAAKERHRQATNEYFAAYRTLNGTEPSDG